MFSKIEEAIEDLKNGKIIIVCDDEDRENEGDFVVIGEFATPENINFMATHGRGLICAPVSEEIAKKLDLYEMVTNNTDSHGTAFTVSIDHIDSTTGISAFERSHTVLQMLNDESTGADFRRPGHMFPLVAKNGGVIERPGHTEAAVDLARMAGSKEVGVICEIMNDDGTMARVPDLIKIANKFNLKMITIKDLIHYRQETEQLVKREVEIKLPTDFGDFKMIGYTNEIDGKEHIAIVKGKVDDGEPVLVRIHSECLTGDVFGSCRCDCGPQLQSTLSMIEEAGKGVIVYMRQEGRGIGLLNKLRAYKLQEEGFDTVEANLNLGFDSDLRDYAISAQIIKDLGIESIDLVTNNPVKIDALKSHGIQINNRVPIQTEMKMENEKYLITKIEKMGHLLHY
ncbi:MULTISPECIES: bifunctional 3,4-dihydroxy-2-butanone-4-phosphate synthase/GTP cyclohydrolase II [Bacillaceae]|uniref:Riboflavin biosynthesis protein RibBA n=1 Tax=Gottfriedia acidiceleris TaxID=371036 RepID=A0ABY4JIS6_9BACI|nr:MULTISPECIES: bifunctional 3,4-dihydroxy-2-butanone-4-phosphate synthase/GTP cyclohydrolase II [Bacillaceae]PEC49295.1 bifunctional 3,4-dihydroxy-2-butanone-4-phosphate synthase/GTP cyclohydrolase II [Bacillus sp. AFS096315]PFM82460.1 bifunctional 3,4-dihydroxy-2-butanone-4-phosphate synthase/GTP cyclohydrolase II [Bacillus sp. AFS077874]UPM53745.1 bifunctional 3,4-dihydroxy-2-butanone-4-phosphate synthase/GTP cyclohydrolase II [Gottfriedia acidiceleris]